MNIIHEFRPPDTTEPSLYASKKEAIRAVEKALERSDRRLDEIIIKIDELEHKLYWNFGNFSDYSTRENQQKVVVQEKPMIQENEMTIVQKAVFAVLLLWSISVTVHLCFQDKSFTDGFFWKYCFSAVISFLFVQLVFLVANRRTKMMTIMQERDAALERLKQIHSLATGEESIGYRDQGISNSPVIQEIISLTK